MLNEIMDCETDGVGVGYSEYNGLGLSDEEKGVLSSLVRKGIVFNSMKYDSSCSLVSSVMPMYCTTEL